MKKIFTLFSVVFSIVLLDQRFAIAQAVLQFKFDDTSGTTFTKEAISNTTFNIQNNFNRPERITGVSGNALRLDGWSTWAYLDAFQTPAVGSQMSIEAWYATEAFSAKNASIIHQEDNQKGFSLQVGSFGDVTFTFWADGLSKVVSSSTSLEKYKWNHIVATVDMSLGVSKIYINGLESASYSFAGSTSNFVFSNSTMFLGRHIVQNTYSGFPLNTLNGAIDEVVLYKNVLSPQQVQTNYNKYKDIIPDLRINPDVRYANDRFRPMYHAMPNSAWTNESYGLIRYKDKYHLFFQKNPNGPYLYFMHWGHLSSPDLVNWTEEKVALAPSQGFDSFGTWSGTTIKNDTGKPVIIYTGVNGAKAGIGVANATNDTLDVWTKSIFNPLISSPPSQYSSMDFRDPYVWKEGAVYYMIVGSGLQNNGGGILFTYKSSNLKDWLSIPPIYQNSAISLSGIFWEMPFFYKINTTDYVLEVTPVPNGGVRAKSIYWIGKFENDKFIPYYTQPKPIEYINEKLLSPSIGMDDLGQTVYMGIIPEDRDVNTQVKGEWRHLFSLPRVVRLLKDTTLGHIPHPNLCRLRTNPIQITNRKIAPNTSLNIPEVEGNQIELSFKIKADEGSKFLIQVYKNTDLSELTSVGFDLANNQISLDRQLSTLSNAGKTKETVPYFFNFKDNISVRLFLDHSTLEVFIDNLIVFSCRVYPSKATSNKIDLVVPQGAVQIVQLDAWQMKPMRQVNSIEVCPISPKDLPERLRTSVSTPVIEKKNNDSGFSIAPSLTTGNLNIQYKGDVFPNNTTILIYAMDGQIVNVQKINEETALSINQLASGPYILLIKTDHFSQSFKIIKQ